MRELLNTLRAANVCMEQYFASRSEAPTETAEETWAALAEIAAIIRSIQPHVVSLSLHASDADLEAEIPRYATNLRQLEQECISNLAILDVQRMELWQEERAIASQKRWEGRF